MYNEDDYENEEDDFESEEAAVNFSEIVQKFTTQETKSEVGQKVVLLEGTYVITIPPGCKAVHILEELEN